MEQQFVPARVGTVVLLCVGRFASIPLSPVVNDRRQREKKQAKKPGVRNKVAVYVVETIDGSGPDKASEGERKTNKYIQYAKHGQDRTTSDMLRDLTNHRLVTRKGQRKLLVGARLASKQAKYGVPH